MIIEKFGHRIEFGMGSSTGHPGFKGMQTSDIREWIKIDDGEWFKPDRSFRFYKIREVIDLLDSEDELVKFLKTLQYAEIYMHE